MDYETLNIIFQISFIISVFVLSNILLLIMFIRIFNSLEYKRWYIAALIWLVLGTAIYLRIIIGIPYIIEHNNYLSGVFK